MANIEGVLGLGLGALAIIGFCGACIYIPYFFVKARNSERLALIDKGMDPLSFKRHVANPPKKKRFSMLKPGLFLIGCGLGVFAGYVFDMFGMDEGASYVSMILIFGGLGLLMNYFIEKKDNKNKD